MTSLRGLAKRLGCGHSAVHKAVHEGRLTAGVRIDGRGQVVVVDAEAAAAQWRTVHVPRLDELLRREQVAKTAPASVTSVEAYDLLAFILVAAALVDEPARAFVRRITARVREAVPRHYADSKTASDAVALLGELVSDVAEAGGGS